jgi:hypothetical protein
LGISILPLDLKLLHGLEKLNVSFNPLLNLNDVATNIEDLRNLKELRIYGINLDLNSIADLQTKFPNLKLFFTKEQLLDELNYNII